MKKADLKVGESYRVRLNTSGYAKQVDAVVEDLDAPYERKNRSYAATSLVYKESGGGIRVRFAEPVFVLFRDFLKADGRSEDRFGEKPVTEYTFGPRKNDGALGSYFVSTTAEAVEREKRQAAAATAKKKNDARRATEFAPVLDDLRSKLDAIGIKTHTYDDGSGITSRNGLSIGCNTAGGRPTSFKGSVNVPIDVLTRLVEIAAKHGETI